MRGSLAEVRRVGRRVLLTAGDVRGFFALRGGCIALVSQREEDDESSEWSETEADGCGVD